MHLYTFRDMIQFDDGCCFLLQICCSEHDSVWWWMLFFVPDLLQCTWFSLMVDVVFCSRSAAMHKRAKRVHPTAGRLADRAYAAQQLGGGLQVSHHYSQSCQLWQWGVCECVCGCVCVWVTLSLSCVNSKMSVIVCTHTLCIKYVHVLYMYVYK